MAHSGYVALFAVRKGKKPIDKVADVELRFMDGPLRGYKLVGFCVWEKSAHVYTCTFPMRPYSAGGQERKQELLTLVAAGPDHLREWIVEEYKRFLRQHSNKEKHEGAV